MNKSKPKSERLKSAAEKVARELDSDVVLFNGELERPYDDKLICLCDKLRLRPNVFLILVTYGGDANAAYRIARWLQHTYKKLHVCVPGFCKSAGTLLLIGAHEVIMSDMGELGPLDIQLLKSDELWEQRSGATVTDALKELQAKSFESFESNMLDLKEKSRGQITLKTAMGTASKITVGLFSKIYEQIDPMYVGEAGRAMKIAEEYGERLATESMNLKQNALHYLVRHYPTHEFVIDRHEAAKILFNSIRPPTRRESELTDYMGDVCRKPVTETIISFLSEKSVERKLETRRKKKVEAEPRRELAADSARAGEGVVADITAIRGTVDKKARSQQ